MLVMEMVGLLMYTHALSYSRIGRQLFSPRDYLSSLDSGHLLDHDAYSG
jgi:hypothetical protein